MRKEVEAEIDRLREELEETQEGLEAFERRVEQLGATVTAQDGLIKVVVGPQGHVTRLELDPRVYRKLSASELSIALLAAIQEAAAQAGEAMKAELASFIPEELQTAGLFDLSGVLPEHPEGLAELKDRYGLQARRKEARGQKRR